MNKFRNKKIFTKDGKFDSKREMHRYLELAAMQEAGEITGLERLAATDVCRNKQEDTQ